jgi:hypothetical protein
MNGQEDRLVQFFVPHRERETINEWVTVILNVVKPACR